MTHPDFIAEHPHLDEAARHRAAFAKLDQTLEDIYARGFDEQTDDAYYGRMADALVGQEDVLQAAFMTQLPLTKFYFGSKWRSHRFGTTLRPAGKKSMP